MRLSIRNRLDGVIDEVTRGEVMGIIRARLEGGQEITAAITLDAIDDLELKAGQSVMILLKATEVSLATGAVAGLSVRNQIPGTISGIEHGRVMTTVKVDIVGGSTLVSAITKDAAHELGLAEGDMVTALVKSTEVSVAVR